VLQNPPANRFVAAFDRVSRAPFFASVRVRLLLLVACALVPALLLIVFVVLEQRRLGIETAKSDALAIVRSISKLQEQIVESTRQLLVGIAQESCVQRNDPASCKTLLSDLILQRPVYSDITIVASNGTLVASTSSETVVTNLSHRRIFAVATNSCAFAVGEYEVSQASRKTTVDFAYPAIDANGEVRAVVVAALDFAWLYRHVTNAMLPPNSSMTVLGRNGMTLARYPDDRFVGDRIKMAPQPANWTWPEGPMTKISRSRDGTMRYYVALRLGTESMVGVNVGIPLEAVYAPANQMLTRSLMFLAIAAGLSAAAAWFGGDFFIVRRIRSLLGVTRRLSAGDLTVRTGTESAGAGELAELSAAFDGMAAALQQRVAERDAAEAGLRELNANLEQRVVDRTAALQNANEELEEFATVVSQDLREPLQTISQYLRLLERRYLADFDQNAREFIGFSRDGAERMQALITGLLDYSRVSTRSEKFGRVSTGVCLRDALTNLTTHIAETGARISYDMMPEVLGDRIQITQLFQNLISNAIRFRSEATPVIHLGVERQDNLWRFSVRDNGIGIREDDFERIFVVFQRLHTRKKYPGTGIGLAACKKIAERHGGQIGVESKIGEGSTFFFTLRAVTDATRPAETPDGQIAISAN
jgi:signal transduction histidine kinase